MSSVGWLRVCVCVEYKQAVKKVRCLNLVPSEIKEPDYWQLET